MRSQLTAGHPSPASSFAIVANGFADGPAQALRDYLVSRRARVVTIFHPLTPEQGTTHAITTYVDTREVGLRMISLPVRPPLSFALDLFIPLQPQPVDAWFGFNPLACARGLIARKQGRASVVVLWSVDFIPERFGSGTLATRVYDRVDQLCCERADARVELSPEARDARNRRHNLRSKASCAHVVPMGAWLDRVSTTAVDGFRARSVVFLGHLVARQGVDLLLEAIARLVSRDGRITAHIIGTGPLEADVRERAQALGIQRNVRFHGFVEDHREIERILASGSIAVAPYRLGATFTRYADPESSRLTSPRVYR